MAKMRTIGIEAKLDEKFKVEVKAGDHIMYIDQTKAGGGTDAGATPLEYLFAAFAGCIGTVARIIATQKGIKLNGIDMKIQGAFDIETMLGKSTENRPGFESIKVTLNIDSDLSKEAKEAFLYEIKSRCPISDTISNPTFIAIEIV